MTRSGLGIDNAAGSSALAQPKDIKGAKNADDMRLAALWSRPWLVALLVALFALVPLAIALAPRAPKEPELKLPLPAFELVSERGARFGAADLRGKVYVADFVFTTCPTVCPKLTRTMADIQRRTSDLGDALHLVTFSVDPETDTPERLAAYAKEYGADPARWTFLTGGLGEIETTVVKGFKMVMGKEESSPGAGIFSIFHGERLVLVDREGNIRGYYDADEPGVNKIVQEARALAEAK